jgi:hypothetical protein
MFLNSSNKCNLLLSLVLHQSSIGKMGLQAWTVIGLSFASVVVAQTAPLLLDNTAILNVVGRKDVNPNGWADSYSVGNSCYCKTDFDHNIDVIVVSTPLGNMTVKQVCTLLGPGPGWDGRPRYNDIQCGNGPPNNAGDEDTCPGRVEYGVEGCKYIGPRWNFDSIRTPTAPAKSPAKAPTRAPAKLATAAPVKATKSPVKSPTRARTKLPTRPTSSAPTSKPTKAPKLRTAAPVVPTMPPSVVPRKASTVPLNPPTSAPVMPTPRDTPQKRSQAPLARLCQWFPKRLVLRAALRC